MIQCLACEDWFHESCLNLRERVPPATGTTPPPHVPPADDTPTTPTADEGDADDDCTSCASDPELPNALLARDDYDALLCGACARTMPELHRHAATANFLLVVKPSGDTDWKVLGAKVQPPSMPPSPVKLVAGGSTSSTEATVTPPESQEATRERTNGKRSASPVPGEGEERAAKKPRLSDASQCKAPAATTIVSDILRKSDPQAGSSSTSQDDTPRSAGDIFLVEGWRDQLCRCDEVC